MSFFAIQPKQATSPSKNIFNTGPGAYEIIKNQNSNRQNNYAPFGSLQKKKNKIKSSNALGPGQYQIRSQICKPSITKYENNNCIIIKINDEGWSQFKSNKKRFQDSNINAKSSIPGPGQYNLLRNRPQQFNKKPKYRSLSQTNNQKHLKSYIESRKPTLFSDTVQHQTNQSPNKSKFKGVGWSLNKKQRFQPLQKQAFFQQHRQQYIQKMREAKKKPRSKSQSAVFASKSLKSQFEADIYQTKNPFKVQLRKMINYKDDRPGPGSYNYHQLQQMRRNQFTKHQFFGSTVERFKQSTKASAQIGPGHYSPIIQTDNKLNKHIQRVRTESQVQQNRHSYIPFNSDIPGPGQYSVDMKRKHKSSCKWVFGSKKPRFSQQTTIEHNQQQMDEIQIERNLRKQKQYQYRKQYFKSRNQPIFASTTKRFQQPKTATQNIQLGQYDITQSNIAQKIKKSTTKQKGIKRFHKNSQSHPFMSSVDRFQHRSHDEEENSHHDCWCLVKSVQKQIYQHQSSAFSSKQKRTVVFENQNSRYTPAVGSYTKQGSFIKSSFNSRFLKMNQTKGKKLKIWNSQRVKLSQNNMSQTVKREQQLSLIKVN